MDNSIIIYNITLDICIHFIVDGFTNLFFEMFELISNMKTPNRTMNSVNKQQMNTVHL